MILAGSVMLLHVYMGAQFERPHMVAFGRHLSSVDRPLAQADAHGAKSMPVCAEINVAIFL